MKIVENMKIITQKEIAKNIFQLVLQGDLVQKITGPGQFVHLKTGEGTDPLLRRPISICEYSREKNQMTLIYRAQGRGTILLSKKRQGEYINVLGPLGNGFPVHDLDEGKQVLITGGGIGVPPLYELSKQLFSKGIRVTHVLGFQSESTAFLYEEFRKMGDTFVATDDGSMGIKGFVTDVIVQENIPFDRLYACGPVSMLKTLAEKYPEKEVYISLEERMSCGIGACFACVKKTVNKADEKGYRKICSDGPVFAAGEVIL